MVGACALAVMAVLPLAACSGGDGHDSAAPAETTVVTDPPTTPAPTTTEAPTTTPAPTTVPPTTAAPTTTVDEAAKRFYEAFGGKRETPTPLPDVHSLQAQGQCTGGPGGYGVAGIVKWSDGVTETVDSPGPFTASATHVATGSRGSWADINIDGQICTSSVTPADRPH